MLPVCAIISIAVLLDFASGLLRSTAPSVSLNLDPLSSDSRVGIAAARLAEQGGRAPSSLGVLVREGLRLSPIDARLYSLLGIIETRAGHPDRAATLFDRALALLPTEIQALSHKFVASLRHGRDVEAVRYLEIIARRWPQYWPKAAAALPQIASDPSAMKELAHRFGAVPVLRRRLVDSLVTRPGLLTAAYETVLRWHDDGSGDVGHSINQVTAALIRDGRSRDAYLLFVLTRGDSGGAASGYVYNGSFSKPLSGNPFDWRISSQSGAEISMVERRPRASSLTGKQDGNAARRQTMEIRFLDNPVHFHNVSQLTRLAPGAYRLSVAYRTAGLRMPEPLRLHVACAGGTRENLGTLTFESGASTTRKAAFGFTVPSDGCNLQKISIDNEDLPMSWRYRYDGTLSIDRVRITSKQQ